MRRTLVRVLGALTAAVAACTMAPAIASANDPAAVTPGAAADRATAADDRRKAAGALVGHGGPIKAVAVSSDGTRALTGSFDYAMMVWDLTAEPLRPLHRLDDHDGAVNAVAFVPGGTRALSAGDDGAVSLWDIATGARLHRFTGHQAKIVGLAVSADGRYAVSSSWDRTARIWDLGALSAGPVLAGHTGPVNAAAFSVDAATVFTASYDGQVRVFRRADGAFERPLYKHGWGVNALLPVGDAASDLLAFGALNGTAGIIDIATGDVRVTLPAHERPVLALTAIARPGLVATGGSDGVIRVSRLADGAMIEEFQNPFGPVWALGFMPAGAALYYGGLDDFASLWQVTPRKPFEPVESPFPRRFQQIASSDDPIEQGRIQFARKCSVCHTLVPDGGNRAGPTLHGVFGRRIASLPGYPYSPGLKHLDIVWTPATVARLFELGPEVFTPGSKMPLQKMTDPRQRDALVAYLEQATSGPADLSPAPR